MPRNRRAKRGNGTLATKRFVRQAVLGESEKKFLDTTIAGTVSDVGSVVHLTAISRGNGVSARDGNRIRGLDWDMRLNFIAGDPTNIIRVIVFQDIQSSGSNPGIANLLETIDANSPLNNINVPRRFKIMSDRMINLHQAGQDQVTLHRSGKLSSTITFNETATTPFPMVCP